MTRVDTHKALYIVAFLALITMLITIHNAYFFPFLIKGSAGIIMKQVIFFCYLFTLIMGSIFKWNVVLLLSIFYIPTTIIVALIPLYNWLFTVNYSFMSFGNMPGFANPLSILLTNGVALTLLLLRLYGYWQERKAGKRTKF